MKNKKRCLLPKCELISIWPYCIQAGSSTFRVHLDALKWAALKRRALRGERGFSANVHSDDFYHPPSMALEPLKKKAKLGIEDESEEEESGLRALEESSLWFSVVRHPFEHFASAYGQLQYGILKRPVKTGIWKDMVLLLKMNMRWVSQAISNDFF